MENLGCLGEAQAYGEGEGGDAHVSLGIAAVPQHTDAADYDGAEHHECAAAEDGVGQGGQDDAQGGDEACQNHDDRAAADGFAVYHVGHGNEAYVLAEGGNGHAAEEGGQAGNEAVHGDGSGHFPIRRGPAKSHGRQGAGVA